MNSKNEPLNLPDTGERLVTETYNQSTIEHLHRYALALGLCDGKDVLDIASGEGYGAHILSDVATSVVGVDVSSEAVLHAQMKYMKANVRYIQGSTSDIPLQANSVDVVVSFETIEHHDKHEEMMSECKRVLRPNGTFIVSSPDKLNYTDKPNYVNPYHVKELYAEEFRWLIKKHFRNVKFLTQRTVYGSLVVPEDDPAGFAEYAGDHYKISSFDNMQEPIYNICIASDVHLPQQLVSFFEGLQIKDNEIKQIEERCQRTIVNSNSYRIGKAITWLPKKILGR